MKHTKLYLMVGERGIATIEPTIQLDTETVKWNAAPGAIVPDKPEASHDLEMPFVGINPGMAYLEFSATTANGNPVQHIFEIHVDTPQPNSVVKGRARIVDLQAEKMQLRVDESQAREQQSRRAAFDRAQQPTTAEQLNAAGENREQNPKTSTQKETTSEMAKETVQPPKGADLEIGNASDPDAPKPSQTTGGAGAPPPKAGESVDGSMQALPPGTNLHEVGLTRPEDNSVTPEEMKTNIDVSAPHQRMQPEPGDNVKEDFDASTLTETTDEITPAVLTPIDPATGERQPPPDAPPTEATKTQAKTDSAASKKSETAKTPAKKTPAKTPAPKKAAPKKASSKK